MALSFRGELKSDARLLVAFDRSISFDESYEQTIEIADGGLLTLLFTDSGVGFGTGYGFSIKSDRVVRVIGPGAAFDGTIYVNALYYVVVTDGASSFMPGTTTQFIRNMSGATAKVRVVAWGT